MDVQVSPETVDRPREVAGDRRSLVANRKVRALESGHTAAAQYTTANNRGHYNRAFPCQARHACAVKYSIAEPEPVRYYCMLNLIFFLAPLDQGEVSYLRRKASELAGERT